VLLPAGTTSIVLQGAASAVVGFASQLSLCGGAVTVLVLRQLLLPCCSSAEALLLASFGPSPSPPEGGSGGAAATAAAAFQQALLGLVAGRQVGSPAAVQDGRAPPVGPPLPPPTPPHAQLTAAPPWPPPAQAAAPPSVLLLPTAAAWRAWQHQGYGGERGTAEQGPARQLAALHSSLDSRAGLAGLVAGAGGAGVEVASLAAGPPATGAGRQEGGCSNQVRAAGGSGWRLVRPCPPPGTKVRP
jgi:hypothetical protein